MQEEWKDIIGYEGYYQISNLGRVKFLERVVMVEMPYGKVKRIFKEKIFTFSGKRVGYYAANLTILKYQSKVIHIHRLIAIHFIDNPFNKKYINHIDGNKLNNAIENLEWVSNRENSCHAYKNAKSSSKYVGVSWNKRDNKWTSHIYHKGKLLHLGRFNTEAEAYKARVKYEQENNIENKYIN